MDRLGHYLSMAFICRGRALEDKERRSEWLGQKCGTSSRTMQLVLPLKKELRTAQVTSRSPTT
jgi:hypothetical protein